MFSSKGNLSTSFIPICGQVGREFTQWWWWRASCCTLFRSGFDWNELEGKCQSHYPKGTSPNKQVTKSSFQDFWRVSNHHGVLIAAKMKPAFFWGWPCTGSTHVQERKQQTICAMARDFWACRQWRFQLIFYDFLLPGKMAIPTMIFLNRL